jgi:hypothetical protein
VIIQSLSFSFDSFLPVQVPIWATTTQKLPRENQYQSEDELRGTGYEAAKQLGWRIFDRGGIALSLVQAALALKFRSSNVMTDSVHYVPYVNDEFNNVLLNMLCHNQ